MLGLPRFLEGATVVMSTLPGRALRAQRMAPDVRSIARILAAAALAAFGGLAVATLAARVPTVTDHVSAVLRARVSGLTTVNRTTSTAPFVRGVAALDAVGVPEQAPFA